MAVLASAGEGAKSLPFAEGLGGKVGLLTVGGGEGEEIEIKLAIEFLQHGCRVVVLGSPLVRLAAACDRIRSAAHEGSATLGTSEKSPSIRHSDSYLRSVELDTSKGEATVEEAVEQAWCAFEGINFLINCASVSGTLESVLNVREKDYDDIMAANVKAGWLVSKALGKKMQKVGTGGSFVFLTSIAGTERGIYPGVSIYGTSMAATNHLTKLMALELGKYGIRVNAIACGISKSNILLELKDSESRQKLAETFVPLQRWSKFSDDITGVVLWLVGDSSAFVTGTITIVDGGVSIRRPRMGEFRSPL